MEHTRLAQLARLMVGKGGVDCSSDPPLNTHRTGGQDDGSLNKLPITSSLLKVGASVFILAQGCPSDLLFQLLAQ